MYWQVVLGIGCTFLFIALFNNVIPWLVERYFGNSKSLRFTGYMFILEAVYTVGIMVVMAHHEVTQGNIAIMMSAFTFLAFLGSGIIYIIIAAPKDKRALKHKFFFSAFAAISLLNVNNGLSKG